MKNTAAKHVRNYRLVECLKRMPEGLDHWPGFGDGESFDAMKSELGAWLVGQPEIRSYIVARLRHLGLIEYDKKSSTWRKVTNLVGVMREAMAGGKDVGKPFIYRPKDLVKLLEDEPLNAKEWFKKAAVEFGISRAQFFRHVQLLVETETIRKNEISGCWTIVLPEECQTSTVPLQPDPPAAEEQVEPPSSRFDLP
jgi:hypothetical protein